MMRLLWFAAGLLFSLGQVQTSPEVIPERLPQAEFEAGWLKLFDGATTFGWKTAGDGEWKVADGALQSPTTGASVVSTTSQFTDFELEFEIQGAPNAHYFFKDAINDADNNLKVTNKDLAIWGQSEDTPKWHKLELRAVGTQITATRDGKNPRKFTRMNRHSAIAFGVDHAAGGEDVVQFRNVKLKPINLPSVFNGKDLSGWKPLPGHPSVFSVTKEGWLNIKNGNGEIQTEQAWSDFTLQMDVYSNGNHLNSGIFFREKAGEFWNGYECQIRNQWQGDDRTKPVDTGTGGLYFRQPARKVVSSDREWFTMTINAVGRHIAIWTDGYLTADFQDTRPEGDGMAKDNFRSRGVIGLQGHDPTTDLSFRNIKIGEVPPVKP